MFKEKNPIPSENEAGLMVSNTTPPVEIAENDVAENTVNVDRAQLAALVEQNQTMKTEIGHLVGLFQNFSGLISGKGITSLMLTLPKLINDPTVGEQVAAVAPIIEKYTKQA